MSSESKRNVQIGNQHVRKHGYYSRLLTEKQRHFLSLVDTDGDVGQDLILLRLKACPEGRRRIFSIVESDQYNGRLMVYAMSVLQRMERTRARHNVQNATRSERLVLASFAFPQFRPFSTCGIQHGERVGTLMAKPIVILLRALSAPPLPKSLPRARTRGGN